MVVEREHVFLPRIGPPLNTQSSESWVLTPVKYVLKSELCWKFTAAEVFWGGNKKGIYSKVNRITYMPIFIHHLRKSLISIELKDIRDNLQL